LAHLGSSPIAVAKTWRLNLAKQLISDTDLPMSRVALAAGFRTVRRFNDSIRGLYGRTPSELRRQRSSALHAGQDEYVFRLPYRPPYDWESIVAFLARGATPGVEEVVSGVYRRSFAQAGRHGILEVRHDEGARALEARVRFSEPVSLLPIVARLRGMFDLAADTAAITRHFRGDPLLGPLVRKYPGLRVPGAWEPFEMAVRAILAQQTPDGAGSALTGELAQRFGEQLSLSDAGGLAIVFPEAEVLARVRLEGLPPALARAIRSLARASANLFEAPAADEESLAALARMEGVEESTAQYIALRAFRQPDAFPADDSVLLRGAGAGGPGTAAELFALAERWRPWRAYAAVYLWRAAAGRANAPSRGLAVGF
jgi:AraC family transcriptional regulator of adaptative response / DNA-3-methyladenine glycosylase II